MQKYSNEVINKIYNNIYNIIYILYIYYIYYIYIIYIYVFYIYYIYIIYIDRYSLEWERIVKRMGRWISFENDYKTMDIEYMESVWWVFK